MKLLAIDTCTSVLTVAVCDDSRIVAETYVECGRAHSERLIGTIDWCLAQAKASLGDLDALAVTVGPGSFTGLRIGVSAMKGLALAADLPLIPVPTLDAFAAMAAFEDGVVCPLLDARMKEIYGAAYRFDQGVRKKLLDDRVCSIDAFLDVLPEGTACFLGDGAALYGDRIRERRPEARFAPLTGAGPRAAAVAAEARRLWTAAGHFPAAAVSPVYLRKSQAEQARDKQLAASDS